MICLDTSVVIAGFGAWHDRHADAQAAFRQRPNIAVHTMLETYSVLTRLPFPARAPTQIAREFLSRQFPDPLVLEDARQQSLVVVLEDLGVSGGAVYDGLIALTAAEAGATLLTLDRRALATYLACGAQADFLG